MKRSEALLIENRFKRFKVLCMVTGEYLMDTFKATGSDYRASTPMFWPLLKSSRKSLPEREVATYTGDYWATVVLKYEYSCYEFILVDDGP